MGAVPASFTCAGEGGICGCGRDRQPEHRHGRSRRQTAPNAVPDDLRPPRDPRSRRRALPETPAVAASPTSSMSGARSHRAAERRAPAAHGHDVFASELIRCVIIFHVTLPAFESFCAWVLGDVRPVPRTGRVDDAECGDVEHVRPDAQAAAALTHDLGSYWTIDR